MEKPTFYYKANGNRPDAFSIRRYLKVTTRGCWSCTSSASSSSTQNPRAEMGRDIDDIEGSIEQQMRVFSMVGELDGEVVAMGGSAEDERRWPSSSG